MLQYPLTFIAAVHGERMQQHFLPSGKEMKKDPMKFCSHITEVVAQMLIGHALGPKEAFLDQVKQSKSHNIGLKATLETCTARPKALFPFHLTPYPELLAKLVHFINR